MKLLTICTALLPCLVQASPLWRRDAAAASSSSAAALVSGSQTLSLANPTHTKGVSPDFSLTINSTIQDYLANNRHYVDVINQTYNHTIFETNAEGQSPHTFWIGCSDSRAGEQSLATLPGEIFTHRNIANVVNAEDISSQGALQYAVDVLKVKKIIVCGHTECGGVAACLSSKRIGGVLDNWLNPIRQIRAANNDALNKLNVTKERTRKLAELNVISSVTAVRRHPSAVNALMKGDLEVWGMIYDVSTGYLSEVKVPADKFEDLFHLTEQTGAGH